MPVIDSKHINIKILTPFIALADLKFVNLKYG
jgi:hypothetical protein